MPRKKKKLFVLDTSVILYDHNAVKNFEEHDVCVPIVVLEELDKFKKGNDTKNYEAREFIRMLDKASDQQLLQEWTKLEEDSTGRFKVEVNYAGNGYDAREVFADNKNDNKILNTALFLKTSHSDRNVILVTKDINLRLKAKSLNLQAEDYETGKIKDLEHLYTGNSTLNEVDVELIDQLHKEGHAPMKRFKTDKQISNHYYVLKNGRKSCLAYSNPFEDRMEKLDKMVVSSITPKNAEQAFAVHAIMNPKIKLVALRGVAGTGKTLISLAGALEQRKEFKQIYLTRPIIPLNNKDIGYLPGDIKMKLNPYMEPLYDNLKFIKNQYSEKDKEYRRLEQMVETEKLAIQPLAYIRGRSLSNVFFIVDEAQNLTPLEVKTIVSRAGENTKIVFTGDIHQIDTPYLDEQSNGLSYLIDKLKGQDLFAHITLEKGERSELANLANELL